MCLTIRGFKTRKEAIEFSKKPKKATKDITVYKVLTKSNKSIYQYFPFEKGREYYRYGKIFGIKIKESIFYNGGYRIEINEGLHAYTTKAKALFKKGYDKKVVKMIIPKGSLYFEDKINNEIVSSRLWWP